MPPGPCDRQTLPPVGQAPRLPRDPTMQRRLALCRDSVAPALIAAWPETGALGDGSVGRVVVFVHGTLSCGLAHIQALARHLPADPNLRAVRYEHDTFLPTEMNGEDLGAQILRFTGPRARIVIVGHSRGGLVARAAAGYLAARGGHRRVGVCTFGTPHRGTPIVQAGHRVLAGLAGGATAGVGALPGPALAAFPLKYLFGRLKKLPAGIAQMQTPGPTYLNLLTPPSALPLPDERYDRVPRMYPSDRRCR
jgi:pimeloyl-ACP methyl ester carboxylesterase